MASSYATLMKIGREHFWRASLTIASCGGESFRPAILSQLLRIWKASSSGNLELPQSFHQKIKTTKEEGKNKICKFLSILLLIRLNGHWVHLSLDPNNFRPAFFYHKEIQAQSVHSFYPFKVILLFRVSNFKKSIWHRVNPLDEKKLWSSCCVQSF